MQPCGIVSGRGGLLDSACRERLTTLAPMVALGYIGRIAFGPCSASRGVAAGGVRPDRPRTFRQNPARTMLKPAKVLTLFNGMAG